MRSQEQLVADRFRIEYGLPLPPRIRQMDGDATRVAAQSMMDRELREKIATLENQLQELNVTLKDTRREGVDAMNDLYAQVNEIRQQVKPFRRASIKTILWDEIGKERRLNALAVYPEKRQKHIEFRRAQLLKA
jgi:hypothetical protein